ncbi:MAG: thiamine-phosphate kinase [Proteobacteria bacterium]|nr:thiamine-phosphate kinase [Pseudomonadota bacterium]
MASEFDLIRRHFGAHAGVRPGLLLGIGDDAALLRPEAGMALAVTTDMLLEGRHFLRGAEPRALGHKALAVNLSDLAAMGATPRWVTLSLALPAADEDWLSGFSEGLRALAARFEVDLVGGDTTRAADGAGIGISITAIGEVPEAHALTRGGARPGDEIWVSGDLGGASLGLAHLLGHLQLDATDALRMRGRLERPEPRVELGERLRGVASAAIDVSDGFASDLGHILECSGVAAVVHAAALPRDAVFSRVDVAMATRCVLAGGDDYELVFTAPPTERTTIESLATELGLALSCAGQVRPASSDAALVVLDANGAPLLAPRGFDHFGSAA